MNNNTEEFRYRQMISSFRIQELRKLLGAFGQTKVGDRKELRAKAIDLLHCKPGKLNYQAYCNEIKMIYRSMQNNSQLNRRLSIFINMPFHMSAKVTTNMQRHQINIYQNMQNHQQSMQMTQLASSLQSKFDLQRGTDRNRNIELMNASNLNSVHINNSGTSFPSMNHIRFKKLPFYEVIDIIINPVILSGQYSSLPKALGTRETTEYKFVLSPEQINYISANNYVTSGNNEYLYQAQIRIGLSVNGSIKLCDFLPLELDLQVGTNICPLPPFMHSTETMRRIPAPIDCSNFLKLRPNEPNLIKLNWIPDDKTYIFGMFFVKKLSSEFLLQELKDKRGRSSEETKNIIVRRFADNDPDLTFTLSPFSLLCPIGKKRMQIPAKSIQCDHLQCFDANTYILMNEKRSTWTCPICQKACSFKDMEIDHYFLDIVSNPHLPEDTMEIELLRDGTWKVFNETVGQNLNEEASQVAITVDSDDEENEPMPESSGTSLLYYVD